VAVVSSLFQQFKQGKSLKLITTFILTVVLAGCGNLIKSGAIIDAQKALADGRYKTALKKTEDATQFGLSTRDQKAEINYLQGQALEGLGRRDEAIARYQFVAEQLADTPHGYLANTKLHLFNTE